jgi:phosphoribosyl-ATP pyrophosphohydrolase
MDKRNRRSLLQRTYQNCYLDGGILRSVSHYGKSVWRAVVQKKNETYDLADEMADVLFVLICLANQTGINLTEALQKNLEKKTQRDKERHQNNPKLT